MSHGLEVTQGQTPGEDAVGRGNGTEVRPRRRETSSCHRSTPKPSRRTRFHSRPVKMPRRHLLLFPASTPIEFEQRARLDSAAGFRPAVAFAEITPGRAGLRRRKRALPADGPATPEPDQRHPPLFLPEPEPAGLTTEEPEFAPLDFRATAFSARTYPEAQTLPSIRSKSRSPRLNQLPAFVEEPHFAPFDFTPSVPLADAD